MSDLEEFTSRGNQMPKEVSRGDQDDHIEKMAAGGKTLAGSDARRLLAGLDRRRGREADDLPSDHREAKE